MKKSDIRKKAKNIGYKIQFKTNSFNSDIVTVGFKHGNYSTIGSNCFHSDFINEHKQIFELLKSLDGLILECSNQKIKV